LRVAAVAALALAAIAVAAAQAFTPPKGTPDLAKMTLQPSDLAASGKVTSSYQPVVEGSNERAEYLRAFLAPTTRGGVKLESISTAVQLFDTTADATAAFAQDQRVEGSATGRMVLFGAWHPASGPGSGATLRDAHFAPLAAIGAGRQSLLLSMTVATPGSTLVADSVDLRVGDVLVGLEIGATTPKLTASLATGLARAVAAHVKSVLAG
jgi:hypothetical protein